jgi:2-dehydropantoate 2-reductase
MSSRVAVIGPGAIGTTIAAALHQAGRAPVVFGRSARDELRFRRGSERVVVPGPVRTDSDSDSVDGPFDLVFLAVKTTQVAGATPLLRACSGPDTVVCVLQNGIEQVETVAPIVQGATTVPAVVWFPAVRQPDGEVLLRGPARLTLPTGTASDRAAAALDGSWCTVETSEDFHSTAWRKLLQNAVAGLMVLTGRRSGMYTRDDVAGLAAAYLRECLVVARADGAVLDDAVVEAVLDGFRTRPADLGTSILADRVAGLPLEWDARNGVVQRRARVHGIPTPVSDVVVPLLAAASDGPG